MLYKSYSSRMLVLNYQSRLVLVLYPEYSEDFPITNNVDNSRQAVGDIRWLFPRLSRLNKEL
jgi:hypothetical protein